MADIRRSELHVEGEGDFHALGHLLARFGIECHPKEADRHPSFPDLKIDGNDDRLLKAIGASVKAGTGKAIGFVLDVDTSLAARWDAVRGKLKEVQIDIPKRPTHRPLLIEDTYFQCRVGVWLMPNNRMPGAIEHFLMGLIPDDDPLVAYASTAVHEAERRGAAFGEVGRAKATLRTSLAWQEEPGHPYGTAIRAKYFDTSNQLAVDFYRWFLALYQIPPDALVSNPEEQRSC